MEVIVEHVDHFCSGNCKWLAAPPYCYLFGQLEHHPVGHIYRHSECVKRAVPLEDAA